MQLDKRRTKQKKIDKYLEILIYILYFYFIIILGALVVVMPFVMDLKPHDFAEYFGVNSWLIIISVLGLVFTYKLSRMKRWALIALMILIGLEIAVIVIVSFVIKDGLMLPLIPLILLIMLVIGLKHLKNAK